VSRAVVCFATALEAGDFPAELADVVVTGVGPVNAAVALTRRLAAAPADLVLVCGVGGAYPGAELAVGDVVCADSETWGDLGASSPAGFLDMAALGFPVVPGEPPLHNRLPLSAFPAARRVSFVTLSTCTGTDAEAAAVAARTGGAVESMEGAAIVQTALLHDLPVGEIRGISNLVGDRDRARWRVRDAAAAARAALRSWLERRPC